MNVWALVIKVNLTKPGLAPRELQEENAFCSPFDD
jgi:hypothetical protein